jgi:hypothetical protein
VIAAEKILDAARLVNERIFVEEGLADVSLRDRVGLTVQVAPIGFVVIVLDCRGYVEKLEQPVITGREGERAARLMGGERRAQGVLLSERCRVEIGRQVKEFRRELAWYGPPIRSAKLHIAYGMKGSNL